MKRAPEGPRGGAGRGARVRPGPARALIRKLERAAGHPARSAIRSRLRRLAPSADRELVATLSHPDPMMRWEAVNLLGDGASAGVVADVVAFALGERERHARWRSFWAVSRFPRADTEPALMSALGKGDRGSRWNAALLLSMFGRAECVPALRAGVRSRDPWTQWEALSALKALAPAGAEEDIARCLDPSYPRHLRAEAVLAMGRLGSPAARRHLVRALADGEAEVRWRASLGLARFGSAGASALRARLKIECHPKVVGQLKSDLKVTERES